MSKPPKYWSRAKRILSKKDKVMKKLISNYKDGSLVTRNDVFFSLCKSIIGQQISVAAANSVFKKFSKACKGKIKPGNVVVLNKLKLKKCGLSRQKIKGIQELAKKIKNKTFDIDPTCSCGNTLTDACGSAGDMLQYNATCSRYEPRAIRETFMTRFGSHTTCVTTGNGQYEFQLPYCFNVTEVFATVATASTCGTPTIQIQQNALDVLSTEITIDANEKTSRTATVPPVISDNTWDTNGIITFDVDVAGTGTKGLIVYIVGYQRF